MPVYLERGKWLGNNIHRHKLVEQRPEGQFGKLEAHQKKSNLGVYEDEHTIRESLCFILIPTTEHLMQKIDSKPRFT